MFGLGNDHDSPYNGEYYQRYGHYLRMPLDDVPLFCLAREFVGQDGGGMMLEVGCGLGYLLDWIIKGKGATGIGADCSRYALEGAHRLFPGLILVEAEGGKLPFADGKFDGVLAINYIEHVPRPALALREIHRVLRPNAALVVSTPDRDSLFKRLFIHDPTHIHEFTRSELLRLVAEHFRVERVVVTNGVGKLGRGLNFLFARLFPCDIIIKAVK